MTSAYSSAGSNIALIKYWGKADVALNTAAVPSLSLTLDGMKTHTLVEFDSTLECDEIHLDGAKQVGKASSRAVKLLDAIRKEASSPLYARVLSFNNFPTAAGLASSASGFAALAGAARLAAGLDCSLPLLSSWARFCSASAARSVYPGFVELLAETESA